MLDKVKTLVGISDSTKDSILNILISRATEFAVNYTHNDDIAQECENTILAMVVWEYNRLLTGGLSSESYSGVSFNYDLDYPQPLLRTLKAKRKVVVI